MNVAALENETGREILPLPSAPETFFFGFL